MPTACSDRRRPVRGAALAALLCLAPLAACSDDDPPAPQPSEAVPRQEVRPGRTVEAPDVVRGIRRALDRRVEALVREDRAAFLATVAPGARPTQTTYFDNLAQLPFDALDVDVDRATLVRDRGRYWTEVDVSLRLRDYDTAPVVSRDRYQFVAGRGGRFLVSSTTDAAWEETHGVQPQPWDDAPVTVVEGSHALGVFDAGSAPRAARVVDDVEAGIAAVSAEVPYAWDGRVVVYALSDPAFLAGLDGLPGDDPLALDAVTFPVPPRPGAKTSVGTRFVLNPELVARPGPARERLVRHELTHVALGERQDGVPTWLTEGLAEYVSVRPLAPEERAISGAALAAAEKGLVGLPADEEFHGPAAEANYGVSWWACEYVVETWDEAVLWVLLDEMGSAPPEEALERVLQLDERKLAAQAGRLMLATYRPEPEEPEKPEKSEEPEEPEDEEPDGESGEGRSGDGKPGDGGGAGDGKGR